MTHTKSRIVQYNVYPPKPKQKREYYPFGLQAQTSRLPAGALTKMGTRENADACGQHPDIRPKADRQGTTTNVYDLFFRNYDPALGRMNQIDADACGQHPDIRLKADRQGPMAAKYASLTPYNYSFNNPVTFTDPSGAEPPQTINHSAFYNQYYIGYTYDDRIDEVYGTRQYVDNYDAVKRWSAFFYAKGGAGITGSGHWAVGLRGMAENLALLSGSAFETYYGVNLRTDEGRWEVAQAMSRPISIEEGMQLMHDYNWNVLMNSPDIQLGLIRYIGYHIASIYYGTSELYASANGSLYGADKRLIALALLLRYTPKMANGIPNPFFLAEAAFFDKGISFVGAEFDTGTFFIMAGNEIGQLIPYKEHGGGAGTDFSVGIEIGRTDFSGSASQFKSDYLLGYRNKIWVSVSPYTVGPYIGGAVSWSTYDGFTVYATAIQLGFGASPIPWFSGGFNKGKIERR